MTPSVLAILHNLYATRDAVGELPLTDPLLDTTYPNRLQQKTLLTSAHGSIEQAIWALKEYSGKGNQ